MKLLASTRKKSNNLHLPVRKFTTNEG